MSIFTKQNQEIELRVAQELAAKNVQGNPASYLTDTPANKLLTDPRALADVREYYAQYHGKLFADDKEMLEEFHEDQSWDNLNTIGTGLAWAEAAGADEKKSAHMARLASLYEAIPDLNAEGGFADHIGGFDASLNIGQSLLADPLNLIGFGAGGMVAKGAARTAMATGKGGMGAGIKAAGIRGAKVEGALAAPISLGQDALMQGFREEVGLQDEYSVGQGAMATGLGGLGGGILGGIMGAVAGVWGARIGVKEAQKLMDAGYTPDTIPNMSQAEIDEFLDPLAVTPNMEAQAARNAEADQYDTPPSQRGFNSPLNETPAPKADTELDIDYDNDMEVMDRARDIYEQQKRNATTQEDADLIEKDLVSIIARQARYRNIGPRLIEIEQELGSAGLTNKQRSALTRELAALRKEQDEVRKLAKALESQGRAIDLPEEETVDNPLAVDATTPEVTTTPEVEVADPVVEAVAETTPTKMGAPKGEISDDAAALLRELGTPQDKIDKAKTADARTRKRLLSKIVTSKNLLEPNEKVTDLSLAELVSRVKAYTDANPVTPEPEAVAPAAAPKPPTIEEVAEKVQEIISPEEVPGSPIRAVDEVVDEVDGTEATTAAMESDMPNLDDEPSIEDIVARLRAMPAYKADKPTTTDATPEAASPVDPEPFVAVDPKADDPEPLALDRLKTTTLSELGLDGVDEEKLSKAIKLLNTLRDSRKAKSVSKMTVEDLELLSLDITSRRWPVNLKSFKPRMDAVRVIEEIRAKLLPNGVQKNTQSRQEAITQIKKMFSIYGETFTDNAIAFLRRFDELGYEDKAPVFSDNVKGDYFGHNSERNGVNLAPKAKPVVTPRLATYYHEMAHWMYGNILTPTQRIEFMDAMGKYYVDGKLDNDKLFAALPMGENFKSRNKAKIETLSYTTNSDESPQELFAEAFSMFAMRSHASPDAQLESFFQKVQYYFEYLYGRYIKKSVGADPDLERLFINLIPNEKQHRDLLTNGARKVSLDDAKPKTKTGEYIRVRLDQAIYANNTIEGSLGSTTIIENMKDMGAMFMSLAPQKGKGKGKTGGFKQTESMNPELRAASKDIYDTIREYFSEAQGKQGGEVDWGEIESGLADLDMNAEIELSELLAKKWETGGLRELVYKLDDTLRGQYFRHEQELILSSITKEPFPESLVKYRDGFKVKLAFQNPQPVILNDKVVELAVKARTKNIPKTAEEKVKSNRYSLKNKTIPELEALAKGEDQNAIDAATVLLKKWKATTAKLPKNWKPTIPEVKAGNVLTYPEMLRAAYLNQASGDANATKMIEEIRMEMARRGSNSGTNSKSEDDINRLINKETRLFSGEISGESGIPVGTSAIGTEFLEMFTHRDPLVRDSIRNVMWRFLNMLDMDTNSDFLSTKFLDQTTLMMDQGLYFGGVGDPNTPYARNTLNTLDLNSPESKKFLAEGRRIVAMLSGDNPEKVTDGLRGIARLAMRTNVMPPSSKTAVLDIYNEQPEAIKSRIRKDIGGDPSELQEAEQFFTDSFIHYISGQFPAEDNIFKGLNDSEADKVFDIFEQVSNGVKYMTDGVVNKKKLVGIFDELAYSQPQGDNVIALQKADAAREAMLRGIEPETKDMFVKSYLTHLERTNPTRFARLQRYASGYGLKDDGEIEIFWHSTPNGGMFDRSNNPVMRPSKDGQHGRGVYMTESGDISYSAFAKKSTDEAMMQMAEKTLAEKRIDKSSPQYQLIMKDIRALSDLYGDSSVYAGFIMKGRQDLAKYQVDFQRLSLEDIDAAEVVAKKMDDLNDGLDHLERNFIDADLNIKTLEETLNRSINLKADPVMIPFVLRADRVAKFDVTMHRMDSDLIVSILGRMKGMESSASKTGDLQNIELNGMPNGVATRVATAIRSKMDDDGRITGQGVYDAIVSTVASDFDPVKGESIARSYLDEVLESLGYEAKVGNTSSMIYKQDADGNLINGKREFYKEVVVFDSRKAKHLASDLFDEESSNLYKTESIEESDVQNPNTPLLLAAINSEGDINKKGFANVVNGMEEQGASPTLTSALVSVAKGRELTEGQSNALKQYGPKLFFSKGSDRLRSFGMKWLGDFIQPVHGTGFHEKQNSELGRRIIPIIQRIKTLPDSKGVLGAWASKNNPLRTNQADSVTRIVKTLRRPLGHESEKRLSPEEFEIYRDLRDLFAQEAVSLKESGVLMGNIEDYFPQVWNKEAMLRNKDDAIVELQKHLMRESVIERNSDVSVAQAKQKAELIFNRLVDDDGVYMPPPTGGRRDATSDHIDYQRMLRLDKYPDSLRSLEKYLETDLEGMMTKYFDLSTRRVGMANKFGTNSHGFYDYIYTAEHGIKGAVELITQGKVFSREIIVPDGTNRKLSDIETELFKPLTKDPAQAEQIVQQAMEIASLQGADAARDFLIKAHPKATQSWEKRADAIANALTEFGGKQGMIPEKEYKFVQAMFNVTQRKPVSPQDTFFKQSNATSKVLRSINSVSLLGWTTLTSLGDLALPLVRSGNFRAWANGMRKWASDPDYRQAIQSVGVAVENLTHERLTGLVGADSNKATNAFFNFTLLTPWTNMNREMAGAVFHQAIITEQRRALTADQGSNKYRTAMRFLNRYGLADYARDGAKDLNDPRVLADDNAVREGMIRFANESIFTPNSNDVPVWAQTPWGSVIFQLKSFPLMMQRLTLGEGGIGSEAMKGNVYPALYALTIGAGFGMASLGTKDVVQSRGGEEGTSMELRNRNLLKSLGYDKKVHGDADDFAGWYYESLMQMGGLGLIAGIMHDSAQQLDNGAYGQIRVGSTVFGPSVGLFGSAYNVAAGGWDATKDLMGSESTNSKERQAVRSLIERVPVIGGVKGVREAVVDTVAGDPESGSSSSGWGSGFSGGFGGGF